MSVRHDQDQSNSHGNSKEQSSDFLSPLVLKCKPEKKEQSSDFLSPLVLKCKPEKKEDLETRSRKIRQDIGLTDYFPRKIKLRCIMKISRRPKISSYSDLPWTLLRELIMLNFEARNECPNQAYELYEQSPNYDNTQESDINFNNHDIFITIYNCCDPFLKLLLVFKMFLCRLAVPLIYPTFERHSLCFSLWSIRGIHLDLNEQKQKSLFLVRYPQKVVSFVRLSRPKFSKSLLLNVVVSNQNEQHHQTFYNKDCPLGDCEREITNGLVEACWYLPDGQSGGVFNDVIMFANLRGDGAAFKRQMNYLNAMSHCLVIAIDCDDINNHQPFIDELYKKNKWMIVFLTGKAVQRTTDNNKKNFNRIELVTLYKEQGVKKKNISDLRKEMQKKISQQLQKNGSKAIILKDWALKYDIRSDEFNGNCRLSIEKAFPLFNLLKNYDSSEAKRKLLPLQSLWMEISQNTKNLKRVDGSSASVVNDTFVSEEEDDEQSALWKKETIKKQIAGLRRKQSHSIRNSKSLAHQMASILSENIDNEEYIRYFLEWIKILFEDWSHSAQRELMVDFGKYRDKYEKAKQQDKPDDEIAKLKKEMETVEQKYLDSFIGLQHIFREIGQIYESSKETSVGNDSKKHKVLYDHLPEIAAKLLILGYPLELMDGDAGNLPTIWLKSVFDACVKLLGNKNVFIVSVLGTQSSGKSTLLNSLFALRFAVSAGRCTKGMYMQLLPVDREDNLSVDYLLVIDTEGLRANEVSSRNDMYNRDNVLATLAVGLSDMTIVNVKGENTSEIKDVMEIVIHALLVLKLANANLNFNTSCVLVHQNVSAPNAASKMQLAGTCLSEVLDEVTRVAAVELGIKDKHLFKQLVTFDTLNDVWYLPDLWHGNPPMTHVNTGYTKKVASIKTAILQQLNSNTFRSLTKTITNIFDLWEGILSHNFVFNFRNSLEVEAYNIMEREYKKITWALQEFQMQWILKIVDNKIKKSSIDEFHMAFQEKYLEESAKLKHFFEQNHYKKELIKRKEGQMALLETVRVDIMNRTKAELKERHRQSVLQEEIKKMQQKHLEELNEHAEALAKRLNGRKESVQHIEDSFEDMWSEWLYSLSIDTPSDKESLEGQIFTILCDYKTQMQSLISLEIERQNLSTGLKTLSSSALQSEFERCIHIRSSSVTKNVDSNLKRSLFNQVNRFQEILFSNIHMQIHEHDNHPCVRFQNGYLVQLLNVIDNKIDEHNDSISNAFQFLPQYRAMIMVFVSRYALHFFTEMNKQYDRENSPIEIIKKYKITTWNRFRDLVEEKSNEFIFATCVCEQIKNKLNETIPKYVSMNIQKRVLTTYSNTKLSLIIDILDHLADQDNFEMYVKYITIPDSYALQFIKEHIDANFFKNSKDYVCVVREHVTTELDKFETKITEAGRKSKTEGKMEIFISSFKDVIPFPNNIENEMCKFKLNSVDNVISELSQKLSKLQEELVEGCTAEKISFEINSDPYRCTFTELWGCEEICPFCGEPCQKMKNHTLIEYKNPHTCVQHRPIALTRKHWPLKNKLAIESCSFCVQSKIKAQCSTFHNKCRETSHCNSDTTVYHPFKNYKHFFPDWDIPPSSDMESSKYWMWFTAHFSKELAEYFGTGTPDIPDTWKSISKEEARGSLKTCYKDSTH